MCTVVQLFVMAFMMILKVAAIDYINMAFCVASFVFQGTHDALLETRLILGNVFFFSTIIKIWNVIYR